MKNSANKIKIDEHSGKILYTIFESESVLDSNIISNAVFSMGFLIRNKGEVTFDQFADNICQVYDAVNGDPRIKQTVEILRKY